MKIANYSWTLLLIYASLMVVDAIVLEKRICDETLFMDLGVTKADVRRIFLSVNDTRMGIYRSIGPEQSFPREMYKNKLTFDIDGDITIMILNISRTDAGKYRFGIMYNNGSYKHIDLLLTFYDKADERSVFAIEQLSDEQAILDKLQVVQKFSCLKAVVKCSSVAEAVECTQEMVTETSKRTEKGTNRDRSHSSKLMIVIVVAVGITLVVLFVTLLVCTHPAFKRKMCCHVRQTRRRRPNQSGHQRGSTRYNGIRPHAV